MAVLELESPAMQELDRARMRELRESLELSQVDAAKKASMSLSQWNDIETGRKPNVTVQTLSIIAAALGCDARELLTPAPKGKKGK
jgi:transcriptional regulator with XRE-family HTH domain